MYFALRANSRILIPSSKYLASCVKDWVAGRIEIRRYEDIHENNMEHYYTPSTEEWANFCNTYNGKWVDKLELNEVVNTLKTKFYKLDENHNPIF